MRSSKVLILIFLCIIFFLLGFEKQQKIVPTEIEKIDLKLRDDEVAVTFLSLNDGEATLIQNRSGEAFLINTGHLDSQMQLTRALNTLGIVHIKGLILTRTEPSYIGNVNWLQQQFDIKKIIVPKSISKNDPLLSSVPSHVESWNKGVHHIEGFDVSLEVLQLFEDENAMNLMLQYGKHRFLFMSFADESSELELINGHSLKDIKILKVAEFAKNTGTSQQLLEAVDPQVAVIFQKRNGYPSADVLERLQSTWIDIYYTKQFGNVTIKCNKDNYEVITLSVESSKELQNPQ